MQPDCILEFPLELTLILKQNKDKCVFSHWKYTDFMSEHTAAHFSKTFCTKIGNIFI